MSDLLNKKEQDQVNEIDVIIDLPEGCEVNRACDPEELFEMIEQCKICGRCV
jgi:hypothetical protein